MLQRILILFCAAFLFSGTAVMGQPYEADRYCNWVDSLYAAGKLTKKILPDMSYCGGSLQGYFENGKLVLIESVYAGEFQSAFTFYYIQDTTLVKLRETKSGQEAPADRKNWCKTHKKKDGSCDFSTLKKIHRTSVLYFDRNFMVYYFLDGKMQQPEFEEAETLSKRYYSCFKHCYEEIIALK